MAQRDRQSRRDARRCGEERRRGPNDPFAPEETIRPEEWPRGWDAIPNGRGGLALDLGGRHGELESPLRRLGYRYVTIDYAQPFSGVRGDAHRLPFPDGTFSLIVSYDSLEHFSEPWIALAEARRVLTRGGCVVISVPFLHPFHGDDLWRYTPLGLRRLLDAAGFDIELFEGRDGLFTAMAMTAPPLLDRLRLRSYELAIIRVGKRLDRAMRRFGGSGEATAHAFFVVARARDGSAAPPAEKLSA